MRSRLQVAKSRIISVFEGSRQHVFTEGQLLEIRTHHRDEWRLTRSLKAEEFIKFLLKNTKLRAVRLSSQSYPGFSRYVWGDASPYELGLSVRRGSYLSHGTAVFLLGLTEQIPKTIYINREQSPKRPPTHLTQEGIDRAFSRAQRQSEYVLRHG